MAELARPLSTPERSSVISSIQRKPVPLPSGEQEQENGSDTSGDTASRPVSINAVPESPPKLKVAPISPVRLSFHPDNWAQPSNASIEENYAQQEQPFDMSIGQEQCPPDSPDTLPARQLAGPVLTADELVISKQPKSRPQTSDRPLPPTPAADIRIHDGGEKTADVTSAHTSANVANEDVSAAPTQNSPVDGDVLRNEDPNRQSRDTDKTASTKQPSSVDTSSAATDPSSVSQGASANVQSDGSSLVESVVEGDSSSTPPVMPLQYHHQPAFPSALSLPVTEMDKRSSSNPDFGEAGGPVNRHLTPTLYMRRSSLPRPQSNYSLHSNLSSPRRSPGDFRTASGQSRKSPEHRPASYAELLNVPYPQPAPAPINIDNSALRSSVGTNAALLGVQKTLDMYRQNVKKTNDFGVQYSFAVFLINTAQEQGFDPEERSRRKASKPNRDDGNPYSQDAADPAELVREAKNILTRLANGGYPFAQYYLADGYASGLFNKGKEDYHTAFPLFALAAKHGHAESAYRAGLCCEFGWGCRKDPAKAVQYLRTAASRSHPGAMTRLGKACLSGDLGDVRYREGVKWLKRATETADTMYNAAPYHLGLLYETGYGDDIFKDEGYAAELFTQAAELGNAEASFRMGDAYEHGKLCCPRDPALSVHFYTGAAERGHAAAMMGLCAWYMVGAEPLLEKDEEEAYEWARRSAELGFVKAQYAVGYFTEMGIGCRRDILEANVWYVKAADAGDERAKQRLAAIRAAISGGTPMEVVPPRNAKMRKSSSLGANHDNKDCSVM